MLLLWWWRVWYHYKGLRTCCQTAAGYQQNQPPSSSDIRWSGRQHWNWIGLSICFFWCQSVWLIGFLSLVINVLSTKGHWYESSDCSVGGLCYRWIHRQCSGALNEWIRFGQWKDSVKKAPGFSSMMMITTLWKNDAAMANYRGRCSRVENSVCFSGRSRTTTGGWPGMVPLS